MVESAERPPGRVVTKRCTLVVQRVCVRAEELLQALAAGVAQQGF